MPTLQEAEEDLIDAAIRYRTDPVDGLGARGETEENANPLMKEFCSAVDALLEAQRNQ